MGSGDACPVGADYQTVVSVIARSRLWAITPRPPRLRIKPHSSPERRRVQLFSHHDSENCKRRPDGSVDHAVHERDQREQVKSFLLRVGLSHLRSISCRVSEHPENPFE
jgi:hypothetical protein